MKTKAQILEEKQLLNEDFIENALMVAGFVPIIGNFADIILMLKYYFSGQKLYAALMLFTLIPVVGDIIILPLIRLLKLNKITTFALKNTDNFYAYLVKNPEAKKMFLRLENHIDKPIIGKLLNQLDEVPKIGPKAANGLRSSLQGLANVLSRLLQKPISIAKSIGKEVATSKPSYLKSLIGKGPVASGIKKHFQGQRLASFIAKHGRPPSNWIYHWWYIVFWGRFDRRAYIKYFIISNKLLEKFGLPNFESFVKLIQTDDDFREQLANDEQFTNLVGETTEEIDLNKINAETQTETKKESDGGMSNFTKLMGINLVKKLAQSFI
jgi:hypothetical protein